MIDRLADMAHEVWAHWMRYLFSVSIQNEDGSVTIPADKVERWKRQMDTNYYDLTGREQKSDINQAKKYLTVFRDELDGLLSGVGWGDEIIQGGDAQT